MDCSEEILKKLNSDEAAGMLNMEPSKWDDRMKNLEDVTKYLEENIEKIPEDDKTKIAGVLLSYEKRVDELKSSFDKILQMFPQHRSTRGRTRGQSAERKTESGYESKPSSIAVSSTYEPEEKVGVPPSSNGSFKLAPGNGSKTVVQALSSNRGLNQAETVERVEGASVEHQ